MLQSRRYPGDWVELHGGQADPVYAAANLADATEVAQADNTADAREPADGKLSVAAADAGLSRADAPSLPTREASPLMLQPRRSTKPRRKKRTLRSPT